MYEKVRIIVCIVLCALKRPTVFVSYRREDSLGHAGSLTRDLRRRFGSKRVFMDLDTISAGERFADVIERRIASSDVLLAVIGKHWLSGRDGGAPRLESPTDFVRAELRYALDGDVSIVPILVQGAAMPESTALPEDLLRLCEFNAFEVRDSSWDEDVERLVARLRELANDAPKRRWPCVLLAMTITIVGSCLGYFAHNYLNQPSAPPASSYLGQNKTTVDITPGSPLGIPIRVPVGYYARVEVEQFGLDVREIALDDQGTVVAKSDSPCGEYAKESILIPAERATGDFTLQLESVSDTLDYGSATHPVSLVVSYIGPVDDDARKRVRAKGLLYDALELQASSEVQSGEEREATLRSVRQIYLTAQAAFPEKDAEGRADALAGVADVASDQADFASAARFYSDEISARHSSGEPEFEAAAQTNLAVNFLAKAKSQLDCERPDVHGASRSLNEAKSYLGKATSTLEARSDDVLSARVDTRRDNSLKAHISGAYASLYALQWRALVGSNSDIYRRAIRGVAPLPADLLTQMTELRKRRLSALDSSLAVWSSLSRSDLKAEVLMEKANFYVQDRLTAEPDAAVTVLESVRPLLDGFQGERRRSAECNWFFYRGSAAFFSRDYEAAIGYWEKADTFAESNDPLSLQIEDSIRTARKRLPSKSRSHV